MEFFCTPDGGHPDTTIAGGMGLERDDEGIPLDGLDGFNGEHGVTCSDSYVRSDLGWHRFRSSPSWISPVGNHRIQSLALPPGGYISRRGSPPTQILQAPAEVRTGRIVTTNPTGGDHVPVRGQRANNLEKAYAIGLVRVSPPRSSRSPQATSLPTALVITMHCRVTKFKAGANGVGILKTWNDKAGPGSGM